MKVSVKSLVMLVVVMMFLQGCQMAAPVARGVAKGVKNISTDIELALGVIVDKQDKDYINKAAKLIVEQDELLTWKDEKLRKDAI